MRIILYGPPGSGKGTQGDLIQKKYGFPKISTGDLLRGAVQEKTLLGLKADAVMRQGLLVSDEIVLDLLKDRVLRPDCGRAYVLDGFPRNIAQAKSLEDLEKGRPEMFIEIRVDEDALVERLTARRICSGCGSIYNLVFQNMKDPGLCKRCGRELLRRPDDTADVIRERFRVYNQETLKIREYYTSKNVYHCVDGLRTVEKVFEDISAVIDGRVNKLQGSRAIR